jgi:hypothetical protein
MHSPPPRFPTRWVALALALLALPASGASAQDADTQARTHFESGRLHFDRGAYEEAQAEFEAAFELSQRPDLLYNLYLCAERLGQLDDAIGYLERYLAEGAPEAERRASLEPRLINLRERRDHLRSESASTEPEPPPTEAPAAAPGGDLVPAIVLYGGAGLGLVAFAVLGGAALAEDASLERACGVTCGDDRLATLGALTVGADVGWISALALAGVGTVLLFTVGLPPSPSAPSDAVALLPSIGPTGAGLHLTGSF